EPEETVVIEGFTLFQNYPNPFNPSTTIRYHLPSAGKVVLDVYNLSGKKVAELVNEIQNSGEQTVTFKAKDLPTGVYFYRLKAGHQTVTQKMLLVR
ncbi:MAG: T9SS type A sorting domain-containing protein, partial [Calditrichota bacterium]